MAHIRQSNKIRAASAVMAGAGAINGGSGASYSGGVLTLSGSFPSKSQAAPFFYDDFEGRSVGQNVLDIGWANLGSLEAVNDLPKVTNARSFSGTKSVRMDYKTGQGAGGNMFPKVGINGLSTPEVYISCNMFWERYVTGNPASFIFKICRAGANPAYSGLPHFYDTIRANHTTGLVTASDKGFTTSDGYVDFNGADGNAHRDQWNRLEYRYKLSTVGQADGAFQTWTNLQLVTTTSSASTIAGHSSVDASAAPTRRSGDGLIIEVLSVFTGLDSYGLDNAYYVYCDNFYIDTTCTRVEVGDASTLAACTKRVIAIPTAWSPSSITANLDTGPLGSGTRYVFVFDANNQQYGSALPVVI